LKVQQRQQAVPKRRQSRHMLPCRQEEEIEVDTEEEVDREEQEQAEELPCPLLAMCVVLKTIASGTVQLD
jgi:hypothetical protein